MTRGSGRQKLPSECAPEDEGRRPTANAASGAGGRRKGGGGGAPPGRRRSATANDMLPPDGGYGGGVVHDDDDDDVVALGAGVNDADAAAGNNFFSGGGSGGGSGGDRVQDGAESDALVRVFPVPPPGTSSPLGGGGSGIHAVRGGRNDDVDDDDDGTSPPLSSYYDLFSLTENDDVRFAYATGCIFAFLNGLTSPALAYVISSGLTDLASAWTDQSASHAASGIASAVPENGYFECLYRGQVWDGDGIDGRPYEMCAVGRTVLYFLGVGVYSFLCAMMQNACMEVASTRTERMFLTRWFGALLKQDAAFYDVYNPSTLAPTVAPNAAKIRKGLGRKLGEGVQYLTAFVGGLVYAFLSNWRVALVLLATVPIVSVSIHSSFRLERSKAKAAAASYEARAAKVARSATLDVRTMQSRNAEPMMTRRYGLATADAYRRSVAHLWRDGAITGAALLSLLFVFCIFTLYGSYAIYRDVLATKCDPSGAAPGAIPCDASGTSVLGALLGVACAARGMALISPVADAIYEARVGCHSAMIAIRRTEGADAEEVVVTMPAFSALAKKGLGHSGRDENDDDDDDDLMEGGGIRVRALLPRYVIDASSTGGMRPPDLPGAIAFQSVRFAFPTKRNDAVLDGLDLTVEAGTAVALVGAGGSGKSTIGSLLQRFYDPSFGAVSIDGHDLRDLNIHYLRSKVRYVGPDPVVFETTIAANIKLGKAGASFPEIIAATEMAGIHKFIMSLPHKYKSVIGDGGVHLSAGQMQCLALARALVSDPSVLIVDEATKALDRAGAEAVQDALDVLASRRNRTTIIIPTRISTVRHLDSIVVLDHGKAVEIGTHDELMGSNTGYYRSLLARENSIPASDDSFSANWGAPLGTSSDGGDRGDSSSIGGGGSSSVDRVLNFRNVTFSYPARPSDKVLDGFDLSVRRSERLALVGPRVREELAALSLAARFYDPTAGSVEYGGTDLRDLDVTWLREQIFFLQLDPGLLNTTIRENIDPNSDATRESIVAACHMARVHKDIQALPLKYDTEILDGGAKFSLCMRQRIAIACAILRNPPVVLLDEGTSTLGCDLEEYVQEALDGFLNSEGRTTLVVAQRNASVLAADRIAFVAKGKVRAIGTHEELMNNSFGQYRHLVQSQRISGFLDVESLRMNEAPPKVEDDDEEENDVMLIEEHVEQLELKAYDYQRARAVALPDATWLIIGSLGSLIIGCVFPSWGFLFGYVLAHLFRRIEPCDDSSPIDGKPCSEYFDSILSETRERSIMLGIYWFVIAGGCLVGTTLTFWSFGVARERLNKRLRDSAFASLVRQDVAYFDRRGARRINCLLQDDVARVHVFSGEPIRVIVTNLCSLAGGLAIACVKMWPMALCSLAVFPFTYFATDLEVKNFRGDGGTRRNKNGFDSPEGILLETLLNIRTVSGLGIERQRYRAYQEALRRDEPHYIRMGFVAGFVCALPPLIQQLCNALQYWWGGWLLYFYGHLYTFDDLVLSMFSLFFAQFALASSPTSAKDLKICSESAGRVFYLLDRERSMDIYPQEEQEEKE